MFSRLRIVLVVAGVGALPFSLTAAVKWTEGLKQPPAWYDSAEATTIANRVLSYQTKSGGWPKNHDMTQPPDAQAFGHEDVTAPTIDNGATYTQIRFLARVAVTHPETRYRDAVRRGLEYLLAAQYENGGWPQFYPLIPGYYTHITFNDDAMIGVLQLLRDVARGTPPFALIEESLRQRAATAEQKGIACILRCQITSGGAKTVWCAQHDENTFEPVPARKYEHGSPVRL